MKHWLSNWKRRRKTDVAAQLRASKPEPSARFVKTLAARINPRSAQPVRTRTRLGLAAAVTATMVAVVGATGGFSSAASSIRGATHSVAHITHITSTPSALVRNAASAPKPNRGPISADAQYAVAPTISGFSPDTGAPGSTVTVSGTNFSGESAITSVSLAGSPASFQVQSAGSLTFTVPAGASSGTITVSNAAGPATSTDSFTVIQIPQFGDTPFTPSSGGIGTMVTLSGTHFTGVNSVTIGGKAASIDSLSDSEIDTSVPVGAKLGAGSIVIKNAAGTASASGFTVLSGAPTITSFLPASGVSGDSITIKGTNLDVGSPASVFFSGAGSAAVVTGTPTNTQLIVTVPNDAETGPITVSNDNGSGISKTFIVLGTPNISGVSPAFGVKNTPVVITGDTFTGAKSVTFLNDSGNVTVSTGLGIKGDTQITVKAPATLVQGLTYTISVTGKTNDVSDPSSDTFYFESKPNIDHLAPATGGAGQTVAIFAADGSSFLGATKVTFGGKPATIVSQSDGEIDALVPAALNSSDTPKTVPVVVSNAAGAGTAANFSALNSAPTVKTFTPAGKAGDTVTITGTHLNNSDTSVTFLGGSSCTVANGDLLTKSTTGSGSKAVDTITFLIPSCARTGALEVDNADGSTTTKPITIYVQPVVLGFQPAATAAGKPVTVVGGPGTFAGAFEVDFNTTVVNIAPAAVAKDGGSLTVTVPKTLAIGSYQVTVRVDKTAPISGNSGNTGLAIVGKPTITDFGGSAGGAAGDSLTINGTNLLGVSSVKFGSVSAVFEQVSSGGSIDSTKLKIYIPAGATSNKISVTNPAGSVTSSAVLPILAITKTAPASLKHGATTTLSIMGSGFKFGGSFGAVTIGGESVTVLAGSSDTKLQVKLPGDLTAGSTLIQIDNDLGSTTFAFTIT